MVVYQHQYEKMSSYLKWISEIFEYYIISEYLEKSLQRLQRFLQPDQYILFAQLFTRPKQAFSVI